MDALRCAAYLAEYGPSRGVAVARDTGVPVATRIMADNHYGWFEKVGKGIYNVTPQGLTALADHAMELEAMAAAAPIREI